jgi:hypothetical protein
MRGSFLFYLLMAAPALLAQDSTLVVVAPGQNLYDLITTGKRYRFPQFTTGKLLFRDGSVISNALLNYNFLNGELEFLTSRGDTLSIAMDQMLNIKHVAIDSSTFYYDQGYLELVASSGMGRVLKRERYEVYKREKIGAYDQPTATSSINTAGSFYNRNGKADLVARVTITMHLKRIYYFSNQYMQVLPATRKNFIKLFPSAQAHLETYLQSRSVNFNSADDLKALIHSLK